MTDKHSEEISEETTAAEVPVRHYVFFTGELCLEIAAEQLELLQKAMERRGFINNFDYNARRVLKTMATSLER